jgi:hypothetical protein
MIGQPPPAPPEELDAVLEQPPVAPAEVPVVPPVPAAPELPVVIPEQPPIHPSVQQAQQEIAVIAHSGQRVAMASQVIEAQQAAADQAMAPVRQALAMGQLSPDQAAPLLERYQAESQERFQKLQKLGEVGNELRQEYMRAGYEYQDHQRRAALEPFAEKYGIELLVDEAAIKSGDPEGFNKKRLQKRLSKAPPDAWRALQEDAVDEHRERQLERRADAGTDEMGGAGTGAGPAPESSGRDDITAGLRELYGLK